MDARQDKPSRAGGPGRHPGFGSRVELWLLRHAEVHGDWHGVAYGNLDVPLSSDGLRETGELSAFYAALKPACVHSSPLQRALELGRGIARGAGAQLQVEADLREIERGSWQGRRVEHLRNEVPEQIEAFYSDPWTWRGHGGECDEEILKRAWPVAQRAVELAAKHASPAILTTHYNVLRTVVCYLLGLEPTRSFGLRIDPGRAVMLRDEPGGWVLVHSNLRDPKRRQHGRIRIRRSRRVKVLYIAPVFPWPLRTGGKIRTFNLIRSLSRKVEVHLRAVRDDEYSADGEREVGRYCASVRAFDRTRPGPVQRVSRAKLERWFHSPGLRAGVAQALSREHYDLVHLDELIVARCMPPNPGVPVVQHHQKLETVLYDRLTNDNGPQRHFDLWKLRRLEREAALRTRYHVVCGEQDADILEQRYDGLDFAVVPSGIDPHYFRPSDPPIPRRLERLLFVGTLSYGPNVDALRHFVRGPLQEIRRLHPNVQLLVVGGSPTPEILRLHGNGIKVIGGVVDVRPYLEGCSMLVVPLRIGGGTRLKIVEALAMGCPVVSTSVGAEGLGLKHREHLHLCDDDPSTVASISEILSNPEHAKELAAKGNAYVLEHFNWDVLADRLLDYWKTVIEREAQAKQGSPS